MQDSHYMLNGRLYKTGGLAISPYDRSFMLGDGLIETVKVTRGKAVWLEDHLERMESSASFCGIPFGMKGFIPGMCEELIDKNAIENGFLRITLSRGVSLTGRFSDMPEDATLAIIGARLEPATKMIKAAFAPWPMNESDPAVFHKTASRFSQVVAFREAGKKGLDELVFLNTKGEVSEGIFSNVFWVKDGDIHTPSGECGLLPGIARARVMECAKETGVSILKGRFSREDILGADEIFFTNSVIGACPCVEFEGRILKAGETGRKMADAL